MESPFTELNNKWQVESATPTNSHTENERESFFLVLFFFRSPNFYLDCNYRPVRSSRVKWPQKSRPGPHRVVFLLDPTGERPRLMQVKLVGVRLSIHHRNLFFFSLSLRVFFFFQHTWIINTRCQLCCTQTDRPAAELSLLLLLDFQIFRPFFPFAGLTEIFPRQLTA